MVGGFGVSTKMYSILLFQGVNTKAPVSSSEKVEVARMTRSHQAGLGLCPGDGSSRSIAKFMREGILPSKSSTF